MSLRVLSDERLCCCCKKVRRYNKYSLFGWGLPSILLLGSVLMQYHDKAGRLLDTRSLKAQNCWFLDAKAFVYCLIVPSSLLASATFYYLFRSAILSRYIVSMQPDQRARDKMRRKRTLQIILFTKITIVLCVVLVLASLSKLLRSEPVWISFHIVQGLQGILIAMLVTCNCQVLKLYTRSLKSRTARRPPSYAGQASATALSKSTSLQLLTWDPPPDLV